MTSLRLFVLGPPRLQRNDRPIELSLRRALALLIYLVLTGQPQSRGALATLLWPDSDDREARARLRRTLHRLAEVLGEDVVLSEGDALCLAPNRDLWVDSVAFEQQATAGLAAHEGTEGGEAARQAHLAQAAALYADDFLAGFGLPDNPGWDEWQFYQREGLRQRLTHVLAPLVAAHQAQRTWEAGIPLARRWVALDPLHEPAQRALMRLYAHAGQQAAAMRQYQECARLLAAELGVPPEDKTSALYEAIRTRRVAPRLASERDQPARSAAGEPTEPHAAAATAPPPDEALHRGSPPDGGDRDAQAQAPHNLPVALTRFIGREAECRELRHLLSRESAGPRLVTLTGAGGGGKTRLALEAAAGLVAGCQDGVWLVELAPLADPALVPQAIASTLGLRNDANRTPTESLIRYLQRRQLLLVADNCEHLIEACAEVAVRLLRACPHLQILATSRQPLGIAGETAWPVPPLRLPDPARLPPLDDLSGYEAIQLFVDRARASQPSFTLTGHNAASVARVCQHLDGMPLAIELAAARVRVLSPEQIASRLGDRFQLLTSRGHTAPPRQQTLRAAVEWSYDLLTPAERALFSRLSVFAGGWSLEAAEAVCGDDVADEARAMATAASPVLPAVAVFDVLSELVDKSLVVAEAEREGGARYRLLETIRQYGQERLATSGETDSLRSRHAAYYLALAEHAEPELVGARQVVWLVQLERELDNLRAALEWSKRDGGDPILGMCGVAALSRYWWLCGHLSEAQGHLEALLARPAAAPRTTARARALDTLGVVIYRRGDYTAGYERACACLEECLTICRELGDRSGAAAALRDLGQMAIEVGDYAGAQGLLAESLRLERELADEPGLAMSLSSLGWLNTFQQDYAAARPVLEEGLAVARVVGDHFYMAVCLFFLGWVATDQGNYTLARAWLAEIPETIPLLLQRWSAPYLLEGFARLAEAQGQAARALRLVGAATALREAFGASLAPAWQADLDRRLERARQALGPDAAAAAWAEGRALTPERALAEALADSEAESPS